MRPTLRCLGWLVVALSLTSDLAIAEERAFTAPGDFTAIYDLKRAGLKVGQADLRYRRIGRERYTYSLYTRATGLARLVFSSRVRERSIGHITAAGFQPDTYRYVRSGGDDDREAELRFDWDALEVVNDIAEYPWRMAITQDTIDRVISPLQLMHDLYERSPGTERLIYRIADGGQLKTYLLTIEGSEIIETPTGRFQALRIRRRDTDSDRETILWCAPALQYLAVRVEQWEGSQRSATLELAQLEGLAREPQLRADH